MAKYVLQKLNGKLEFIAGQKVPYDAWVSLLDDRQMVVMSVSKKLHPKTQAQLAYYFAVVLPHARQGFVEAGYDSLVTAQKSFDVDLEITDEHVDMLLKSLYQTAKGFEKLPLKRSMDDAQMSELIDWSIRWIATNLSVAVPSPETGAE